MSKFIMCFNFNCRLVLDLYILFQSFRTVLITQKLGSNLKYQLHCVVACVIIINLSRFLNLKWLINLSSFICCKLAYLTIKNYSKSWWVLPINKYDLVSFFPSLFFLVSCLANTIFINVTNLHNGSRSIAPEENCPPTPKLTLSQTQTLTGEGGGNFPREQLSGCPPTLKVTLTLTQTPTLTGGNFPRGNRPDTLRKIFLKFYDYLNFCYFTIFGPIKFAVENFITSTLYFTASVIYLRDTTVSNKELFQIRLTVISNGSDCKIWLLYLYLVLFFYSFCYHTKEI